MQQQPRMVRDYHDWRASRQPPGATLLFTVPEFHLATALVELGW